MALSWTVVDWILITFGIFLLRRLFSKQRLSALPPGPPRKPIIGNLLEWPKEKEWETFSRWHQAYGDIVSAKVLNKTMIILNSYAVAEALLEQKGAIYSDRPALPMLGELAGWNQITPFIGIKPDGRMRFHRRFMQQIIGTRQSMKQFHILQEEETLKFLRSILNQPQSNALRGHVARFTGAVILRIAYGYKVLDDNDPWIELLENAMADLNAGVVPGQFLVDVIPRLKYIPDWFPGAGFKKLAKEWSARLENVASVPFDFVKSGIADGTAQPSFVQSALASEEVTEEKEYNVKWAGVTLYMGGADTTTSALYALFLCLAQNPDVLKRAQEEIDSAVGDSRLPTFADRSNLPYVDALCKELMRWNAVGPTGPPHCPTEDDVYQGYHIPAGSMVFFNLEAMLHDPATYPDPYAFKPERYLPELSGKPSEQDPYTIAFSLGRRMCPGLHLADANLFIVSARIMSVFNVTKVVEDGKVLEPVYEKQAGLISHPAPFKVAIAPRSQKAEKLIRDEHL